MTEEQKPVEPQPDVQPPPPPSMESPAEILLKSERVTGFRYITDGDLPPNISRFLRERERELLEKGFKKSIYEEKLSNGRPKIGSQFIDNPLKWTPELQSEHRNWYPKNILPPYSRLYLVRITPINIQAKWFNVDKCLWEMDVEFQEWAFIPE